MHLLSGKRTEELILLSKA